MSNFHKNFPFGKGIWIWNVKDCLGGNVDAIIQRMKDKDLQYALIKAGDGPNTWQHQWYPELVKKFHDAGLKVLSWSYVYGLEPVREGQIASWALNQGGDGHVFDAESEFEHLSNPIQAAEQMLQVVRGLNPDAFLAHSPFPIIDYHTKFPYATFGKYCDAVMPQVYQGDFKMPSIDAVNWMYEQWSKWEAKWPVESRKPIIPVAQTYDNYQMTPPYVLSPKDIKDFVGIAAAYKSVNFYEFAHINREECWEAIRVSKVTPPTDADLGRTGGAIETPPVNSTPTPTPPAQPNYPTVLEAGRQYGLNDLPSNLFNITNGDKVEYHGQAYIGTVNDNNTRSFVIYIAPAPRPANPDSIPASTTPPVSTTPNTDNLPTSTPVLDRETVTVPSTVIVRKNSSAPGGVELKVIKHKPHIDSVIEFFTWIFSQIANIGRKGGKS